ncbi:helicase associated domain-containing protein [Mycolicibacterium pyrenivorans]|uniref:helicase associated domain-containing protein n=1 Tax=Mycolicibacterium pyrenivorans TaxID=187102 RepID=UPI0035581D96
MPGWTWGPRGDDWGRGYDALRSFAEREGHSLPPAGWIEKGVNIHTWEMVQRRKVDRMTDRRREILESLPGWAWRIR